MGTKTKFILDKMTIGYLNDFKKALTWQQRLSHEGINIQTVTMSASLPDDSIDGKRFMYVIDDGMNCRVTNNFEEYLDFLCHY